MADPDREDLAEALSDTIDDHDRMQQTVISNRIEMDRLRAEVARLTRELADTEAMRVATLQKQAAAELRQRDAAAALAAMTTAREEETQ